MKGMKLLVGWTLAFLILAPAAATAGPDHLGREDARTKARAAMRAVAKKHDVSVPRSLTCRRNSPVRFTCRARARGRDFTFRYRCDLVVSVRTDRTKLVRKKCVRIRRPYLSDEDAYEAMWLDVNAYIFGWLPIGPLERVSRIKVKSYFSWQLEVDRWKSITCDTPLTATLKDGDIVVTRGLERDNRCWGSG